MNDLNGRQYAKLSELKAGDTVQVDSGFTCIGRRQTRVVQNDETRTEYPGGGLWIKCKSGRHYLDGQLPFDDPNDDSLIGVYKL